VDQHLRAGLCQGQGSGAADAARGAVDQGVFPERSLMIVIAGIRKRQALQRRTRTRSPDVRFALGQEIRDVADEALRILELRTVIGVAEDDQLRIGMFCCMM